MTIWSVLPSSRRTLPTALALLMGWAGFVQAKPATANEQAIMSHARQLFKTKKFKQAAAEYAKIPMGSLRWPLAKEELAWTHFRMKEHSHALAHVRSLTNDFVNSQIDLEPFLLQSIVLLYNCDYKGVFKTLSDVRTKMLDYVEGMEKLAKGEWTEKQREAVDLLIVSKNFTSLKPAQFHELPRRFYLDRLASMAIKNGDAPSLRSRLIQLAAREDRRSHKNLQHLHLVEVEAVQRAFVPNEFDGRQNMAIPNDENLMIFNRDKELWADEIDKVQADVDLCVSKTGRTL